MATAQAVMDLINKKNYINLILVGLLLVLLGLSYFLSQNKPGPETPLALTQIDPSAIDTLGIFKPGQPKLHLQKHNNSWRMSQYPNVPVNQAKIKQLLTLLSTTSYAQYALAEVDSTQLGVNAPHLTIQAGARLIEFGELEPLQQRRYIKMDNTIHLIQDEVSHLVKALPDSLIETALFPESTIITRLSIPDVELIRKSGVWQSPNITEAGLSQDNYVAFINKWQYAHANAAEYIQPDRIKQLMASGRVKIETKQQTVYRFEIYRRQHQSILYSTKTRVAYLFTGPGFEALTHFSTAPTGQ